MDVVEAALEGGGELVHPLVAGVGGGDDVEAGAGPDHVGVGELRDGDRLVRQDGEQRPTRLLSCRKMQLKQIISPYGRRNMGRFG